jgi:hypothetical protein
VFGGAVGFPQGIPYFTYHRFELDDQLITLQKNSVGKDKIDRLRALLGKDPGMNIPSVVFNTMSQTSSR